ncbi:AraC family transcriptional regulator [Streptomyces sp. B8F3]|uniref:helix-turn-helix transcriptional regulator n=1 Tax=unclassified Streptomyces TaxID=2593676 RepID=UPI00325EF534
MIETLFRTQDVPAADRAEAWRDQISRLHAPLDLGSRPGPGFHADMRLLKMERVLVWPNVIDPVVVRRTPRLIRQCDPEMFHLSLLVRGAVGVDDGGVDAVFGPYDLRTNHSSHALAVHVRERVEAVSVEVPRAALALAPAQVQRVSGRGLSGRSGIGALLAEFLRGLVDEAGVYTAADLPRLETVFVDLLSALLARETDAEDLLTPEARARTRTLEIQSFILRNLHDPELTPAAVAAAHHISPSYLHRLFRGHGPGATVADWIRGRRLERARRILGDPAQRAVPVHRVASRCGFEHHAVFTRAFSAAYGLTPRDYRRAALTTPGTSSPSAAGPPAGVSPR